MPGHSCLVEQLQTSPNHSFKLTNTFGHVNLLTMQVPLMCGRSSLRPPRALQMRFWPVYRYRGGGVLGISPVMIAAMICRCCPTALTCILAAGAQSEACKQHARGVAHDSSCTAQARRPEQQAGCTCRAAGCARVRRHVSHLHALRSCSAPWQLQQGSAAACARAF